MASVGLVILGSPEENVQFVPAAQRGQHLETAARQHLTEVSSEHDLTAAMQQDEQIAATFWWSRTQREAFVLLRKLEPFCWWHASKLWRWLAMGRHVKVPEGKGQLGADGAPFVVLIHGIACCV